MERVLDINPSLKASVPEAFFIATQESILDPQEPKPQVNSLVINQINKVAESPQNPQSPQESVTPFFDINKSASHYRFLVEEFGQEKGTEIAKKTFIRDLESQAWELAELPTPFKYNLFLENIAGENRLIHESNLEDKTDLVDVVTDKIRNGLEKKQALLYKQALFNAQVGETILWVSPKEEGLYPDSQLIVARKTSQNQVEVSQYQCDLDQEEMAQLLNKLLNTKALKENSSIEEILLTLGSLQKEFSNQDIWQAMEQVSGRKILKMSPEKYQALQENISQKAKVGGNKLLDVIKKGLVGQDLSKAHIEILKDILGDTQSSKIHRDTTTGEVSFETSCGMIGSIRGMSTGQKKEGQTSSMWCTDIDRCGKENTCNTDFCYNCGAKLSSSKPFSGLKIAA